MRRILIFNTIGMGYEGISSVIMNYLEHMDLSNLDITVATFESTKLEYINRISKVSKVAFLPDRKHNLIKYMRCLIKELRKGYDIFHIHGNSGTMFIEVLIAKFCGVKKVIIHVHNSTCDHLVINQLLKRPMNKLADVKIACSIDSGRWLYGKKKFVVLNNAIDLGKYSFNLEVRNQIRNEYKIADEYVIGHSGSFIEQKNHSFLIDIFYEFQKKVTNSRLMLLSDGPNLENIKEKVSSLGIENKVIFLGRKSDAHLYYNAMDCFVLPSKWEGLPLVALEAQASSLPVIVSDNVTKEVACSSNIKFISLNEKSKLWADIIKDAICCIRDRKEKINEEMQNGEFDIISEAKHLREIYLED